MGIGAPNPLLLHASAGGGEVGEGVGGGDVVTRSLRFKDNAYLSFTPSSATSTRQKAVINFWFKLAEPEASSSRYCQIFTAGTVQGTPTEWFGIMYGAADSKIYIANTFGTSSGVNTNAVFRDYGSFYNLHLIVDTTQATSTDRFKLYINGERQTLTGTFPTQNSNMYIGETSPHRFGWQTSSYHGTTFGPQVYIANAYLLENSTLPYTDFIEDNGYGGFKPKATSGLTFGTNGFHLKFEDSSDIGSDSSGNSNDFTATNLASHDVMPDVPYSKNYATLNSIDIKNTVSSTSEGNLKLTGYFSTYYPRFVSTFGVNSGKWYWEVCKIGTSTSWANEAGVKGVNTPSPTGSHGLGGGTQFSIYQELSLNSYDGNYRSGSGSTVSLGAWNSDGDIIGIALDLDSSTKTIQFYKNGSALGSAQSIPSGEYTWTPAFDCLPNSGTNELRVNFGQDPTFAGKKTSGQDTSQSEFYYAPPTGFNSLNTSNLDDPTVKPHEHFNTKLYSGSYAPYTMAGSTTQAITGVGFQPDIVWIKDRDNASGNYENYNSYYGHYLFDSLRGAGSAFNLDGDVLYSSTYLNSGENGIDSFDSDGFTVDEAEETNFAYDSDYDSTVDGYERYAAWCWKLGQTGSSSTWASGNTNPTSEKYNANAGVSLLRYEDSSYSSGTVTLNHSLGAAPEFAFVGNAYGSSSFPAWHKDLSANNYLSIDSTSGQSSGSTYFPSGCATATTFTVGSSIASGYADLYIYLFTSVEGVSKVGFLTGNGSSDGPFIYTGFRPAFVLVKNIDSSGPNWGIQDNRREGYNPTKKMLYADSSSYEGTVQDIDLCSNGFKVRNTYNYINQNGSKIVFLAFAESPLKYANAR